MLNVIWGVMMAGAVVVAFLTGNMEKCSLAAIDGAAEGIKLIISLCGSICFWSGMMEIADKSGLVNVFSSLLRPFTKILFPNLKKNGEAMGAIVMNITANMLGMSNAATPLGIRAMEKLQKENQGRKKASHEMCTFVLINTASVQIIPTTLIALRSASGSAEPTKIIVPIWITSILVLCTALISAKILKIFSER